MRITKLGHACVRLETGGTTVVIDPGGWTEPDAADGATAVLVTHEHPDHLDADRLRRTDAPVYTIEAVAAQLREQAPDVADRVRVVSPGDELDVGVPVTVVGERHAVIHPAMPRFDNSGYLLQVEGRKVFHPGDAISEHPEDVDLLLLPVHAPWNKFSEVCDYALAVGAPVTAAIHDGLLNDQGHQLLGRMLTGMLGERGQRYVRVEPGSDVDLG